VEITTVMYRELTTLREEVLPKEERHHQEKVSA
jgi:hypothetical protein